MTIVIRRLLLPVFLASALAFLVLVAATMCLAATTHHEAEFAEESSEFAIPEDTIRDPGPTIPGGGDVVEASLRRDGRARGTCLIRLTGADSGTAGFHVAVFDGRFGGLLGSRQVDAADAAPLELAVPAGRHLVRIARCLPCARLAYTDGATVEVPAGGIGEAELSCTTRSIRITLAFPEATQPSSVADIPVWIQRAGDPRWRYREPDTDTAKESLMLTDGQATVVFRDLGAGTYTVGVLGWSIPSPDEAKVVLAGEDTARTITVRAR